MARQRHLVSPSVVRRDSASLYPEVPHHRLDLFTLAMHAQFVPGQRAKITPWIAIQEAASGNVCERSRSAAENSSRSITPFARVSSQKPVSPSNMDGMSCAPLDAEGTHMIQLNNVLVATDFGEASTAALAYGREFARTFGARLYVLHVIENPMVSGGAEAVGVNFARMQAELEAGAQQALDRLVTAEDREQLRAVTTIRTGSSSAYEIVNYAKLTGIDVIIMGTHGRGFMTHLLMGSVAEKVVRMAPCPVLTVRHPEHEFILPDALQVVGSARRL
jgi:nucleotide-binding universal stress UspA family protein